MRLRPFLLLVGFFFSPLIAQSQVSTTTIQEYVESMKGTNDAYTKGSDYWKDIPVVRPELFQKRNDRQFYKDGPKFKGYLHLNPESEKSIIEKVGGDWGSSGGGDAVVCFNSSDDRSQAQSQITSNGYIEPELLLKAKTAYALEVFESLLPLGNFNENEVYPQEKVDEMILRFEDRIKTYTPIINNLLVRMRNEHPSSQWIAAQPADIPDSELKDRSGDGPKGVPANPDTLKNANCVLTQTVLRLSERRTSHKPNGYFLYNPWIYHQLFSPLSRYIMDLHEHFYFIANSIGHSDSGYTRDVINLIFFDPMWKNEINMRDRHALINYFFSYLGDYMTLWSEDLLKVASQYPDSLSLKLYTDFISLAKIHRKTGEDCQDKLQKQFPNENVNKLMRACMRASVNNPNYVGVLTPSQMFLFLAFFHLDLKYGDISAREFATFDIYNPQQSNESLISRFKYTCHLIREIREEFSIKTGEDYRSLTEHYQVAEKFCAENEN